MPKGKFTSPTACLVALDGPTTVRTNKYVAFWMDSPLCNFWNKPDNEFVFDLKLWRNSEAAMMYQKAKLFGDTEVVEEILTHRYNPGVCKGLGRQVKNFDEAVWQEQRMPLVYDVLLAKFSQNLDLTKYLIGTGSRMLVEASPHDKLWGNGLEPADPRNGFPVRWKGLNLLGKVLEQVRFELRGRDIAERAKQRANKKEAA